MPYSTVHGERAPDDRYARVHFFQNGLPFDGEGRLVHDHPDVTDDPKLQARAEKLISKAAKKQVAAPGDDADPGADPDAIEDEDDEDEDRGEAPVNLQAWAMGEQKVEWQKVSDAIATRLHKRVANKLGALEALIEAGIVAEARLSKEHKKVLGI